MKSADIIYRIIKWQPNNLKAIEINSKIQNALSNLNTKVRTWVNDNEESFSPEFTRRITKAYGGTYDLPNLYEKSKSFDDFIKIDSITLCLLARICNIIRLQTQKGIDIISDRREFDNFLERCTNCFST